MDRNVFGFGAKLVHSLSLSARRAWIEIAEIVFVLLVNGSLSARRAWIEIAIVNTVIFCISRSPQGERG